MDTTALDQYIEAAIKEPVCIEKNGRKVAVLMSYEEYEQLQKADDYLLGLAAKQAQHNKSLKKCLALMACNSYWIPPKKKALILIFRIELAYDLNVWELITPTHPRR